MFRLNVPNRLSQIRKPTIRQASSIQNKAPLAGRPRPIGFDQLKFNEVQVEEIHQKFASVEESLRHIKNAPETETSTDSSTKLFRIGFWISGGIFIVGLFYACADQLYINTGTAFTTREHNARAYEKQAEILHLYENNITKTEYVERELEARRAEYQKNRHEEDISVMPSDWRRANKIINPTQNFTEEIVRVASQQEDPRSLEEIQASIKKLSDERS